MMNLRKRILIVLFALGAMLWSCNSLIYDDLSECPQGVYVRFYTLTPCDTDTSYVGNVPTLTVFAFDESGKLVTSASEQNVTLSREYEVLMPVSNGNFSFIAWAGMNDNFTISTFTPGTTTKEEVMLAIKTTEGVASNLGTTKVWQGESPVVSLPDPDKYASVFKRAAVNMLELTNRVKLIIEFNPADTPVEMDEFTVSLGSKNGTMNINGSVPADAPAVVYPALNRSETATSFTWDYALMDLIKGAGNNLTITWGVTGETIFDGDFVEKLLLNTSGGNINLACENDFEIRMKLTDYCETCETRFTIEITVNDWEVYEYEVDLGN